MSKLEKSGIKRAAIYFFFDEKGVVDDYNIVLLDGIKTVAERLVIVVNGNLTQEGKSKFEKVTNEIIVRENVGFDVWAYKTGLDYIGWEELKKYDELVMLNFTNYGPIYPFEEMFSEMTERDIDFWGVVMRYGMSHDPYQICKYGYIPDHISSSFMVIRQDLLWSQDFHKYWKKMPQINSYNESVCFHEAVFTEDFKRKGYVCDNYINAEDLREKWDYVLMLFPYELVKNRRCPIIKRKTFYNAYEEFFMSCTGDPALKLMDYLEKETEYDTGLIWGNLLRTVNMWDLKQRMQLQKILDTDMENTLTVPDNSRVAIVFHSFSNVDEIKKRAQEFETVADVFFLDNEDKGYFWEQISDIWNYEFVCVLNGNFSKKEPQIIDDSVAEKEYQCLIENKATINQILQLFVENPYLGIYSPSPSIHSNYYYTIGYEWMEEFAQVKDMAGKMNLSVNIDREKPPVAPFYGMMWFRTKALRKLKDWKRNETNCSDAVRYRLYPFVAQEEGYYSTWGATKAVAITDYTNLYYMLYDAHRAYYFANPIMGRGKFLNDIASINSMSLKNNPYSDPRYNYSMRNVMKYYARKFLPKSIYSRLASWKQRRKS